MLLKITLGLILLALFIQYVIGFERVIVVAELDVTDSFLDHDDDEDNAAGSGSNLSFKDLCCVYGNCSCPSLYNALANLASNVLINISTDVELSLVIPIVNWANITITGHDNPTVNCKSTGGLQFISCYNCTIEGVTWKGCGAKNISDDDDDIYPVLQFTNSSNIKIQNCSFQQSIGQAVVLSGMSGDVNINYCNFLYNKQYKDHGTAIHYSSNDMLISSPLKLMITGCNFSHNGRAKSIIYFGHWSAKICEHLKLQTSKFHHNKGVPIYLSNQDLHINRNIEFFHNKAKNGGGIFISDHSNVIFHKSSTVNFVYNRATHNGGAIFLSNHSSILFDDRSTLYQCCDNELYDTLDDQNIGSLFKFYNNTANGFGQDIYTLSSKITVGNNATVIFDNTYNGFDNYMHVSFYNMYISDYSNVTFKGNSMISFHNLATYASDSGTVYIDDHSVITIEGNSAATFHDSVGKYPGGTIYICNYSNVTFDGNSKVAFVNNRVYADGGAMYIHLNSAIIFKGNSTVNFYSNRASNGGAIYSDNYSTITFEGNTAVTFNSNIANDVGGVMYIDFSTITFKGNSTVTFNDNGAAQHSGAMYIDFSTVTFEENSAVTFNSNTAVKAGGVMRTDNSTFVFEGNSTVTFINNSAYDGGTMNIYVCSITFKGNCTVTFVNNSANIGGIMYMSFYTVVTLKGNSKIMFYNNMGENGGVMYIKDYCNIIFEGNTVTTFDNNKAYINGGVMYTVDSSNCITFGGNSTVIFSNNTVILNDGGAIYITDYTVITFIENTRATFTNNGATNGGAMYIDVRSAIIFDGNSEVTFIKNGATFNGGAMYITDHSTITFEGNSTITFNDNAAGNNGGAMYIYDYSTITFNKNSLASFSNNMVINNNGGAVSSDDHSAITFEGNSTVMFNNNTASSEGGAMYIYLYSTITFKDNSLVTFSNNKVNNNNGGAVYTDDYCAITFEGNSTVTFQNNTADVNGGALFSNHHSDIIFKGNSIVTFYNNKADNNGGAFYIHHNSTARYIESSTVTFNHNMAELGGSICTKYSSIRFGENSFVSFINNEALRDGGAIYCSDHSNYSHFDNSSVSFSFNIANDYGGAIYVLFKESSINLNSSDIHFKENRVGIIQNSVYINVLKSCDRSCLFRAIKIDIKNFQPTTSPHKLLLYNPAKCITGNDTDCDTYYMSNIMLGQDITFDACVHDYYNQPTEAIQFVITGTNHQYYNINGSKYITISCNHATQGITVTGNLHSNNSYNYSMNISLYVIRASESKIISVDLIVELSQCHPGFWYSSGSSKCECYHNDTENIISCSGSDSTIKRGYWFGIVNDKSTVTSCPNDYCNFTCCEITNGIYHLSPVRANQCKPHRSGTACGNCEKGYSLSFDSPNCVEVDKCTIGQTVLVITLSLLYWIAVVVAVFVMMYFKVTVGSLYAIIYYYSVVDILLSQILFISNGLYTTVSIMSSLAKLTPQFLGQLCLVQNMSGIDQQFIHYVHPTVISLILIMIIMLARRSRRVSSFVSRGIIHFICFLVLLSYTSVASTSLLLMRPLKFTNVEKTYTYLSPDIKYFYGRHLVYVITAIIFMVAIVIVFPLLLLLEPYLNSKINFIKIKPLLDQFQGCYKDKYRCFAGYYMICRLVIILLVIVKISDDFINQYILISLCALMQLIHVLVQPYISTFLNVFDGIILQLIVIISGLPVVEFVDNYDETFVLAITYVLVILPLTAFIAMKLWFNKKNILDALNSCRVKYFHKYRTLPTDDDEQPIETNDIRTIIVDDNMRRNATIVDV